VAGHYPPPPVFVGGSQPYAPRLGIPRSNVVNQPPLSRQAKQTLAAITSGAWEPAWSWNYHRPTKLVQTPPAVNQPPRISRTFDGIRGAWETVPAPLQRPAQLPQGGVAAAIQPPYGPAALRAAIRQSWDVYSPQPPVLALLVQPGVVVQVQPPYISVALQALVRSTWDIPAPQIQPLPMQIVSNQVDQPPVRSVVDVVLRQWEPGPWPAQRPPLNVVWPTADNPPPSTLLQTYNLLVRCWEPPFVWPFSYPKAVQPVVIPPGDQPTPSGPLAQLLSVLEWWIPPPWGTQVPVQIPQPGVTPQPPVAAPAGRYRGKKRPTRVLIGGKWYEIVTAADAQEVFDQALQDAEKAAERRTEKAARNEHGRAVVVSVKPPTVSIAKGDADAELVEQIKKRSAEFKAALAAVYRNAALDAELKARLKQQQDDDDDVLLLLH
jgi:hypothetical protein